MPTSELTDALNPFIGQQRQPHYPSDQHIYPSQPFHIFSQQSLSTPHRSELEYAVSEPPPPPRPRVEAANMIQELLRAMAATREAQASENKRRAAWEQELEAKYQQRQAETESQLAQMKRQIAHLKTCVDSLLRRQREGTTHVANAFDYLLDEPRSPSPAVPPGTSLENPSAFISHGNSIAERSQKHGMLVNAPSPSASPGPSNRKRPTPSLNYGDCYSGDSCSEGSVSSASKRPQKRANNHDKTCYTIQTAMRRHIYRVLRVSPEDDLPPSHYEGLPLGDTEPVRFVWEKTIKQSKHNAVMKERVLVDLRTHRRLYEHVPEADFTPKALSSAFDQAFSTFRQKYKVQIDPTVLLTVKSREEQKAMKSRRFHRKKLKREQRTSMRETTEAFAHATFDAAMELDCMSSEESDDDSKQGAAKEKTIVVRGITWRSNRLLKFYSILDEDDRLDKSMKPKRGSGRRDRNEGPPKDNLTLPPKGIASWMVSRRWLRDVQMAHPEVLQAVQELVCDPPGFDWTKFDALGYETDDERVVGIDPNSVGHGVQCPSPDIMSLLEYCMNEITEQLAGPLVRRASSQSFTYMSESTAQQDVIDSDLSGIVSFRSRAKEFVELHDQVQTSVDLLDNLESFLSTFQKDLSDVSGQISYLQSRSRDIEGRLKSRRKIEKPLASLISGLTLPPNLITTILDTDVGEPWIPVVADFERRLDALKARQRVRAARDLGEVAEGLRIVAATKLRAFFHALLQPIRASMTTNMHIIQTNVFLKYRPLYAFLLRRAANVATEIQKAYIAAARTYYETGFRRYMRSLGWIKARTIEKDQGLVTALDGHEKQTETYLERLDHARIEGPGITLAYMANDKAHKEPIEGLLRSALLVLMDNGTAEYTFVTTFFVPEPDLPPADTPVSSHLFSPSALSALLPADDAISTPATDMIQTTPRPRGVTDSIFGDESLRPATRLSKDDQTALNSMWKQIMDPALEHAKTFAHSALEPTPPVVPLLTMIRLTEEVMREIQKRSCQPLETFVFGLRLQMWPLFQRAMSEQIEGLKKIAEGAGGGYFRRTTTTSDVAITTICRRYVVLFLCLVILTEQNEETMIFSNLLRLRQELTKLIETHTGKLSEVPARARARSAIYEELLQGLTRAFRAAPNHSRAQSELVYWKEKEETARNHPK